MTNSSNNLTGVYIFGVLSCVYHGVSLWVGLFWPWYIGAVFLKAGF